MATILDEIIAHKHIEIAEHKQRISQEQLIEKIKSLPKCRDFAKAISKKNSRGINVIAEVKKASPSAGIIRSDFDPSTIAKIYNDCGADAISVLTDEKYFQGKLEFLSEVKGAVDCPVMRKDFIVDPYQVYEARANQADAILLIAEALSVIDLMELLNLAHSLTLGVLVEVHALESLLAIKDLIDISNKKQTLLGINNRNLATMTVDIENTAHISSFVDNKNRLVAESGIKTRIDVERLINLEVGGVLIGETLCRNKDIAAKFRELFGNA